MNKKSKGFTLVELIIVIAILSVLLVIAVPRFNGYKELAEERVCESNLKAIERMYEMYQIDNNSQSVEEKDNDFTRFVDENFNKPCPSDGVVYYENGKIKCSIHRDSNNDAEEPPEEVPFI